MKPHRNLRMESFTATSIAIFQVAIDFLAPHLPGIYTRIVANG
jgi:hypothetical protein